MILILGRFQPFHNGHLKVVQDAYKDDNDITIAIGSSEKKDQRENPFSAEERRDMIEEVLYANNISATIVTVPDIPCDNTYVAHVKEHLDKEPDLVMTENQVTHDLFKKAGYKVKLTPRYFGISSSLIRRNIAEDKEWTDMVPHEVKLEIRDIDGEDRIKRLFEG